MLSMADPRKYHQRSRSSNRQERAEAPAIAVHMIPLPPLAIPTLSLHLLHRHRRPPPAAAMRLPLLLLLAFLAAVPMSNGHNITKILSQHPEFSTFNHYLTATHLARMINARETITVLAVDNAAMSAILSKNLPLYTLKNVLSLHILVDYYGAKKLHQLTGGTSLASTMFQATGSAPGTAGFVNITDHRAGRVSFSAQDSDSPSPSSFVKSVKEIPYNISILQISSALASPAAEAPVAAPTQVNLTSVMAKKGCKIFSDLVLATPDVASTYEGNVGSGLTVFCPIDQAMKAFLPKFKNLTADGKESLLLYHGIPVYNSIQMLKSGNGVVNTLATDGTSKNFNFTVQNDGEIVTLKSRVSKATITGTLVDEDPLAVFTVDQVLEPRELFKKALTPAPAPAPEAAAADAPKAGKKKSKKKAAPPAPSPDAPEAAPADEKAADENVAARIGGRWAAVAVVAAAVAVAF